MKNTQLSELISAYLDGEVTAEERTLVEQTLVEDSTLRRLFYEFRALRERLVMLPRFKVRSDLRRAILGLITQGIVQAKTKQIRPLKPQPTKKRANAQRSKWLAAIWIGSAVAATLLLFVLGPFRNNVREEIALGPEKGVDARQKIEPEMRSLKSVAADPAEGIVIKPYSAPQEVANDNSQSGDKTRLEPAAAPLAAGATVPSAHEPFSATEAVPPKKLMASRTANASSDQVHSLTVVCDVSGPAYESLLRRSLANNNIVWSEKNDSFANLSDEPQPLAKKAVDGKLADADQRRDATDVQDGSTGKVKFHKSELAQEAGESPSAPGDLRGPANATTDLNSAKPNAPTDPATSQAAKAPPLPSSANAKIAIGGSKSPEPLNVKAAGVANQGTLDTNDSLNAVGQAAISLDEQSSPLKSKLAGHDSAAELIYVEASAEQIERFLKEWRANPEVTVAAGSGEKLEVNGKAETVTADSERLTGPTGTARRMRMSEVSGNRSNTSVDTVILSNAGPVKNQSSKSDNDAALGKKSSQGVIEKQISGVGTPTTVRLLLVIRLPKVDLPAIRSESKSAAPK